MSQVAGAPVRALAARVLDAVVHRGRSLKGELAHALPQLVDVRDRALTEAICFTALRQRTRYDQALAQWMPRPLGARDGELRALLWVGLAQLDELALPPHAALSATVEAARLLRRPHQAGMVNALLRRAQREGIAAADPSLAWPAWLRTQVERDWGERAGTIFEQSLRAAPLWLRVNPEHSTPAVYLQVLGEELPDVQASLSPLLANGVRIDTPVAVSALPGFDLGVVSVQDGSAQQVADALQPAIGARVLDACAAPGGKAAHLLERDPTLQLLALDMDARRLRRVQETLTRVGAHARTQVADAGAPSTWWDGQAFDAILLDAPCSATGVVRRQPDILMHRRESDIDALIATQARLLDALWPLLKPGGELLYATCSILQRENQQQIDDFLTRTDDAQAVALDERFGQVAGAGRQRLPGEDGMDGFFYARLRRSG
ncbi:16S rRNA (cytosine(967)-C(5))-methyltransferase RsmB [Pseudoxanthomonas indica]|uniref:16S rRNA (cytosine(967)-C(5))-methyltransferase n=1 Tax=Pseudoxanthomonas indica TaxID=428993 RepID=A0A1T5KEF9_9GAMM|nr:16S rRNA (cytosine(967)-C(5))-methyltransferase RsmB [Pseudoxanthomonas indica]GGD48681.1 ribosomal RNA small subunit methyltransferase B [Pseudoxanthomonas indica]SKC61785.1 16S rRNA (cytosine967-C5)-methyltransferase [Pseudoxanthomonas indica]